MKRSEALTELSHDHHQALFVAKLIKDSETEAEAGTAFTDYWTKLGARHFQIEEEVLLPGSGLPGPSNDADVARLLGEHLEIRRGARRVLKSEASLSEIKELGALLYSHVRFEERELFPRIENELNPTELASLAADLNEAEASDIS
ncbi:MAG: hemerythrin domain-containing protein [Solirubrobacterales bacterium]